MMPRDDWEQENAERLLEDVRRRRRALEDFVASLPSLLAAAPSDEARANIQPLADRLIQLVGNFHMNNLDEMELLRAEMEKLGKA
ncbi:MAG TPA: hypothetical protein VFL17_23715 [Anaerolineae bacterium]|jgi:hypothetical protein|nr:hypothetical protein [Anaerolineae bacterium]